MGLDITAYRQLKKVDESEIKRDEDGEIDEDAFDYDTHHHLYVNSHYPERAPEIQSDAVYTSAEDYGFRAGSYGGYNNWRNGLAELAGYDPIDDRHDKGAWETDGGPFWELINFSDCEGVIGSSVSKKLLADFLAFDAAAKTHRGEYFYEVYQEFTKGLTFAADDGALHFH